MASSSYLNSFDLVSLQYALLAQEHGSFRRAAETLHVRASVVSRRVRALEDAIGVSIFQRESRGVQTTVAGRQILQSGRFIIEELCDLQRTASLSSSGSQGRLAIGISSSIAGGNAREAVRAFLAEHPNIELQLTDGSARDHIAAVRKLRIDVAFVVGTPLASHCELEPLWSEQIMVALPSAHPLVDFESILLSQLVDQNFIISRSDTGQETHDFVINRLGELGRHPLIEPQSVRRESLMALVGLGRGVSIVCGAEADISYLGVALRPLQDEHVGFNAVWSAVNDNPVLRRFLSFIRNRTRATSKDENRWSERRVSEPRDGAGKSLDLSP